MTDRVEDGAGRASEGERGIGRAEPILNELLDAARSAAETMLDDQKQRAAERVAGIAEAVRCAAQSLERSGSRAIAPYADRAAHRIEDFSNLIRGRRWSEIAADTRDFARRQPMLFVLGAAATGFLAGRLLSVPSDRQKLQKSIVPQPRDLSPHRGETDEITAAISKLATPPSGGGKIPGNGAEILAGPGTR